MSQSEERQWYVVYSKPQKEEYAKFHLCAKGLEVFFPRLLLPESARKRKRLVALFPNYLFVRLRLFSTEYNYVIWAPGVSRIVSFNGSPASIDDGIVDFLMGQANQEGIIDARSNLRSGQEVRVSGGPFDGLVGIIQEPPNAKGRVKVLMKLLSREVQVEVPIRFLECDWLTTEA